ncbi:MAG TPA: hypothetical protein VMZ51_05755 [Acidimicrobiales bacterium]|nr:hypothetical protein [Acidimicrobiales bacterium]
MTTWHASPDDLAQFADAPHELDPDVAASLELHLLRCADCRAETARVSGEEWSRASWDGVADRIDRPVPSLVERLLRHLGVAETHARLVAATRPLQLAWLAALAMAIGGTVGFARTADTNAPFLVAAPLVPLVGVVLAFGPGADPAGDAGVAAPLTGIGLALRRAVAVLVATLAALALGALALPDLQLKDAAWVVPALALSLGGLALSTWMRAESAAALLGAVWLSALWLSAVPQPKSGPVTELAPLAAPGQITCAGVVVVALATLSRRRHAFAIVRRNS